MTPRTVIEACCKYFNSTGVEFCGGNNSGVVEQGDFEKSFLPKVGIYNSYDRCDPVFDSQNLQRHASEIECPRIDETTIHQFLKFGEQDKWGKRKPQSVPSDFEVANHLKSLRDYALAYRTNQHNGSQSELFCLGFDVIGLGGGQWHYDSASDQFKRGLPVKMSAPIVRITADSLQKILLGNEANPILPGAPISESLLSAYVEADSHL